uniref:uncharacterized protein LOC122598641 n=1 Tax=Erigeron canadensis TaxID=72917 RepID=UPI001CB9927B|nr:uncharacterized protein LOC122598641 [Erigeron canadensis]
MSRRSFTFEIVDLHNSHENREKIRRLLGDELLEIDRVKPHVIVATSQDPEKVRVALEYKTGKKVILLYENNYMNHQPSTQISLHQKYAAGLLQRGGQSPEQSLHQKYAGLLQHGKQVSMFPNTASSNHNVPAARVSMFPTTASNHNVPATTRVSLFPPTSNNHVLAAAQAALHNHILQSSGRLQRDTPVASSSSNNVALYIQNFAVNNVNINNIATDPRRTTTNSIRTPQAGVASGSIRRPKSYHEHSLTSTNGRKSVYKCSGCKELGRGDRYVCHDCSNGYVLHPSCMYYEERATHKFFQGITFDFHQNRLNSTNRICDACGSDIHGFFYHSAENNKDLHPCCLRLPEAVVLEGRNFRLCKRLTSKCFHCGSTRKKKDDKDKCWCYSSESSQNLQSHVSCMNDALFTC